MQQFEKFLQQQAGATAIEYAFIAAGVSLTIMAIIFTLGGEVSGSLTAIADALGA